MSTGNIVGLPIPRLLPVTGAFLVPFTALSVALALNTVRVRVLTRTYLGSTTCTPAGDVESVHPAAARVSFGPDEAADPLLIATRQHQNFVEYVPLALLLAGSVELNGGNRKALAYTLGALLFARLSHALGMGYKIGLGRRVGFFTTLGVSLGLASWSGWLTKSYWGF